MLVALKLPIRWQRLRRSSKAARSAEQRWEDRLQAIGQQLHETRCQRSQTIEELSRLTHIQPRILRALEQADLSLLPEPVYVRGLLRRYGDILGLDGTAMAESVFQTPKRARPLVEASRLPVRVESWQIYVLYLLFVLIALHLLNWLVTRNALEFAAQYQPIPALPNQAFLSPKGDRPPQVFYEAFPLNQPLVTQLKAVSPPMPGKVIPPAPPPASSGQPPAENSRKPTP